MSMKDFCNEQYKDLLARFGELEIQRKHIEEAQKELLSKMACLNQLSPLLQQIEQTVESNHEHS